MGRKGGCICGAVRYELLDEPLFIQACHCTQCQTATGSAFILTMILEAHNFKTVSEGPTDTYTMKLGSGSLADGHFCGECHSGVWGNPHGQTDGIVYIRGGTLDDTTSIVPAAHIFTKSKQDWVIIPDGVPIFDEGYDVADLWPQESLERLKKLYDPDSLR